MLNLSDLMAPEPHMNCSLFEANKILAIAQADPSSGGKTCVLFAQAVGADANKMIPISAFQDNGLAVNQVEGVDTSQIVSTMNGFSTTDSRLNFQLWRDITVGKDGNGSFYNVAQIIKLMAGGSSFDLAVNLFSGLPATPPSQDFIMRNAMDVQEVAVGWWPGDSRYEKPAFYAYAHPAPSGFDSAELSPAGARWEESLGEYILDWDDVCRAADPHATALEFARSAFRHACAVCGWDPVLAATAEGNPPPVV